VCVCVCVCVPVPFEPENSLAVTLDHAPRTYTDTDTDTHTHTHTQYTSWLYSIHVNVCKNVIYMYVCTKKDTEPRTLVTVSAGEATEGIDSQ
jgi:hypothetical protein